MAFLLPLSNSNHYLMALLYNLGILFFSLMTGIFSIFNSKAKLFVKGRKNWKKRITEKINHGDRNIWIHCASLGEFEQGRPVIEAIRDAHPELRIVLTFFSPSGYEIRKNYPVADCILYLPSDTPWNAERFIKLINPVFVIFVKYEFWHNYISVLYRNNIPLYLISSIFRPEQHFFKWYGKFFRSILEKFEMIFVQDQRSADLLSGLGLKHIFVAGDTRFDRVIQLTTSAKNIPQLEKFRGDEKLFLAGSSWSQDEEIIARYINQFPDKMKWVFAPHEIHKTNIERLEKLFKVKCVLYSGFDSDPADARVMIIDNIGMLSSAYRYAYIAAIGGGFGKGIHNILEPACWGIPVMFGPRHEKFREAVDLINEKSAFSFNSLSEFSEILDNWLEDELFYLKSAEQASSYIKKNIGATGKILTRIFKEDININS